MARYGVMVHSIVMMVATAVLAGACGMQPGGTPQVGKLQRETKSVDPENARSVSAQLKMGAGELTLTGGADQLMEGDFSYNVADWKPKVSYDVSGEKGELVVRQGSGEGAGFSGGAAPGGDNKSKAPQGQFIVEILYVEIPDYQK